MHEQDYDILRSLVSVAWADGTFDEREREMLEALIESFGADEDEAKEIREYAEEAKTLDDIPLNDLSAGDRRVLFQHAIVLTWIDGDQHEKEVEFLNGLQAKLNIPDDEAKELTAISNERAQRLLKMLEAEAS